jgi:RimJ/RimL family protein N-acetyltransferase
MIVKIRPLVITDAEISYRWRNNHEVWKFTGSKPSIEITPDIEKQWIYNVLQRLSERRFAICVGEKMEYVGNVQLTDIFDNRAQFHIFIGETKYYGQGVATQATRQILEYGFAILKLHEVYLHVSENNLAAIKVYENCGFKAIEKTGSQILMKIVNE